MIPKTIENGHRRKIQPGDRAKVRVVYVPATRNPDQQIRGTTSTVFGRLLDALAWGGADKCLKQNLDALQAQLSQLKGVEAINRQVQNAWLGLYDGRVAREVAFRALEEDPAALVKILVPTFRPGESERSMVTSDLSDGLRSLFSLSLSLGLFRVEELLRTAAEESGFNADVTERLPILTVFTVEEPENHLSPHYLGRVIAELSNLASNERSQVLLSSHSPSILGLVDPDNVRYFLGNEYTHSTKVKPIPLPADDSDEAFKYVREAVRGFPELYFARLVILGEGASEEIVLRRLFRAAGTPLDTRFISVVPLGGRHVNHFWRLLHGLEIPYLTLLDLDREKEGAGWGRVQYVRDQLIRLCGAENDSLKVFDGNGNMKFSPDDPRWDDIRNWDVKDTQNMKGWIDFLRERYQVFFSEPLDLDFSMLEAFPDAYKGLAPQGGGPRLPSNSDARVASVTQRMRQVLAADIQSAPQTLGETYTEAQQDLFVWYKYLFVDGSKLVAHLRALLVIDDQGLASNAPQALKALLKQAAAQVAPNNRVE